MRFPGHLRYTKDHEWTLIEEKRVTVGITSHAQKALGDIVFVELPQLGRDLKTHETFGVVESIKAVSELYSPIAGKVTETNAAVIADPSLINQDPHERGWMIRLEPSGTPGADTLLSATDYSQYVDSLK